MTEAQAPEPGASIPADSPEPAAAPAAEPTKPKADLTTQFQENWNKAKASKQREFENELHSRFGTTDLDEIQGKLGKPAAKEVEQGYQEKIAELEKTNQEILSRQQSIEINNKILGALDSLNMKPRKNSTVLNEFMSEHNVANENGQLSVTNKNTGVPVTDGQGGLASIDTALKLWSERPENAFLFARTAGQGHLNPQPGMSNELPKGFLRNPANVEALRRSGELPKAMSGQPVDMVKVEAELKAQAARPGTPPHLSTIQAG